MKSTEEKNEKRQKRGLYFALAVCLVAIAVAGSATYTSVMEYVDESGTSTAAVQDEDPEKPRGTMQEASRPQVVLSPEETEETSEVSEEASEPEEQEEPAQDTAAEPEEIPESESASAQEETSTAEESESEETGTQTYEPSSSLGFPVKERESMNGFSGGKLVYSEAMKDYRTHDGADFSAQEGEKVFSVGNGLVTKTYHDLLLGNVVEMEHGDYIVRYCGLGDTFLVQEGEIVIKGTPIGSVTTVPMEQGEDCHIHLEVLQGDTFVDPMTVLTE